MRKICIYIFVSLTFSSVSFSQEENLFSLSDTIIKIGMEHKNPGIFWDYGKCTLRHESNLFLNSLTNFLKENQKVDLQINMKETCLMEESAHYGKCRAESVRKYLIDNGIKKDRLELVCNTKLTDNINMKEQVLVFKITKIHP